jgi:hypothetical protein
MSTIINTIEVNELNHYQSPITGERWTKEQWAEYVAFEEKRITEDKKHDLEDWPL